MSSNKLLFFVIALAACLTQFAADIYAPSLPAVALSLNTTIDLAQWSMAIYLFGVALTLLIYGPLSDAVGRKQPMVIRLCIMAAGSVVAMLAPNIKLLILGRFIQGCGAGACAGLWRSIFRDVFTGEELAKYGSYFAILVMFIVPLAPALGGFLQHYFDWRANFVFMTIYTLFALLTVAFGFKETSRHHHLENLRLPYVINTFRRLVKSPIFMGITVSTFLSYGAFFAWITSGSVLLIHVLGMSPLAYGLFVFFGGEIAYALAGFLNGRLVSRFSMPTMMRFGWSVMVLSGILMALGKLAGINVWVIAIPIILFYFGSTFIWPNAFATAFTPFGDIAGYAGALYGFMQLSGGAVIGSLMAYLPHADQLPLALVIIGASLLAWIIYERVVVKHQQ
ncbi:multidrug effflux MFS transporter [Coxiella burnetii]|uniref:Bcr/CflA family efflux transporter n=1 Tax=Coxiella burnetii (strain RSA 493 / Nine Mile phase I) TaxID=227377 RepID=Q83AX1_COXBU|nr:multidrug effflux MFS transporter [Coxiella burnetii]NP_820736.1 Bcr family multidrug resistance transporter [Coxiella burnetii RSA 493]AAO91250.1 multidrug resistance transporter, Bcr family [Coxiella burnetii RSA 493]ABX78114.1 drug resistance transporter, Bcr/CflA family [Coxiella burnetii RSA 331]ARI66516.1 Bcr/CflA family drug resistance efflux transporter [Coxiella burnetii]ARK27957.1 Bcr/CflA family drug resistance efflux transporter [Coxiella burnetii]ATN75050.1 MFS transporter [Co